MGPCRTTSGKLGKIMSGLEENSYDAVLYPDGVYAFTHPRHLETMATLFGMEPAPIAACRVLELGSARGGNLIPQALDLPGAEFLGIDLSQRQVEQGARTIEALGLKNIELRRADILDVNDEWGKFGYIICHGILSWVPPNVQEKIFEICRRNLSANGVAFVSYNTYPGWHLVQVVRDMMRYHTARLDDSGEQISQAMAALKFMADMSDTKRASGKLFAEELQALERVKKLDPPDTSYLFHEHLEPHNQPFYFREFMDRAESAGLQYLSEENIARSLLRSYPEKVAEALKPLPQIQREQYMDFLRGRRFRRTLLCHKETGINRTLEGSQMMNFHVRLASLPAPVDVDISNDQVCVFACEKTGTLTTKKRVQKAAMLHLMEAFPNYVHFDELHRNAVSRLNLIGDKNRHDPRTSREELAGGLMIGFCANVFHICLHPARCVTHVSNRPMAGPLCRVQAGRGPIVTNQFHARVGLDDLCRHLTVRLDGRHDRQALVHSIQQALGSGGLTVKSDGESRERLDPEALSEAVDQALSHISKAHLLIA